MPYLLGARRKRGQIYFSRGIPETPCLILELANFKDNPFRGRLPLPLRLLAMTLAYLSLRGSGNDRSNLFLKDGFASTASPPSSLPCPSPYTMNFCVVSSSSPMGPKACTLVVDIPISAPRPSSKPSLNRVDAFTRTVEEFTSSINLFALA